MREYGRERIAASRADPGDDLVTRLVEAEVDGQRLSDDDVVAMITGFVFAGAETTRRQLTAGVQLLADHPDDWERLAAEPDLLPVAVDEILRLRGIVPGLTRRAEEPFRQDDLGLEDGGRLLLSVHRRQPGSGAVRRTRPRSSSTGRTPTRTSPSAGVRTSASGAGLARLELTEALRALTSRFGPPAVESAGPSTGLSAPDWLQVRFPLRPR